MSGDFLNKAYKSRDAASTRALYDDWAASYETEISEHGYATPGRCAAALAAHVPDTDATILDFGCGTGLSGRALKLAGFGVIDGVDLSADMLKRAKTKGIYRKLSQIEAAVPLLHRPGAYAAIAAIGVIGAGAAPLAAFDTVMNGLARGGRFVFSFNDHSLQDPAFENKVHHYVNAGTARILFREHGDHLPGLDIKSTVYVIEKL
jgi:predicted TPR repeat methyltransferase